MPRDVDFVLADEQRRVAEEHVEQQALVRLGSLLAEPFEVLEVEGDRALDFVEKQFSAESRRKSRRITNATKTPW